MTTDELARQADRILDEVERAVVGKREALELVLLGILADGHVLIEDFPGLAKTLTARAFAQVTSIGFARVQFTPDLMPSDVSGHAFYDQKSDEFRIRRGPVFTNLLLADEINRAPAKTQAALLEAMQEQQVTIEGRSYPLPPPFLVIATQNPIEQEGTYPLPEAQLDRFLLKILMDYPEHEDEVRMVGNVSTGRNANDFDLSKVSKVLDRAQIAGMQLGTAQVAVDPVVLDYAVRLARATRAWPGIALGAGPRGSLALVRAARAQAVLDGRDFVTPDDVRAIAKPALRHRLTLAPEMQIEGQRVDAVLEGLLLKVEAPRR